MKTMNKTKWVVGAVGLLSLGTAGAQDAEKSGIWLAPGITAPGVRLEPTVGARLWFTDNMYRTANDEADASALIVDPAVVLSYAPSNDRYRLGYQGQFAAHDTNSKDNYADSELFLTGDIRALARHRFEFDARYKHGHDALGSNRTQGVAGSEDRDLDIWNESGVSGKYTFGQPDATLNLYARAGFADKEYKTNREDPLNPATGTRFLDYGSVLLGGGVIYRLSAKTRLVLDLEQQDIDYDLDASPSFDGDSERALIGVRWLATAKTAGEVMVGHYARNFDAAGRTDVAGFDWQARVNWAPRVASQFTFTTGRLIRETYLLGESFVNEEYAKLGWRQDWSERLYSDAELLFFKDKFEGTAREDDSVGLASAVYYRMSRRTTAKAGLEHYNRDSSANSLDYKRNVIYTGFDVVF